MAKGSQTSTTATEFSAESGPWAPQVPYILGGFDRAKQLYEQGPPDYYPGETLAGFDPAQTFAQEAVINYATGPRAAGMQAGAEGALMQGLAGQTPFSSGQMADLLAGNVRTGAGTPYQAMAEALTGDVIGNLQTEVLPGIRQQQVMYQPGGSSRAALQQNQAVADAVQAGLTTPLAQMYSDAYSTAQGMRLPAAQMGLDQQIRSMAMYPSIMSAPLSMYGAIGDVGAERRAMTQAGIDADMARYAYEANAPLAALQNYMSAITGNYGGTSSGGSSSTSTLPGQSPFTTASQAVGLISGLASLSDRNVKENIVPEGVKWKGLNVYRYNYIGDDTPRRGVMAQEVEIMYPDAVGSVNGIKYVDYGAI